MKYVRMPIEIESPEEQGYDTIRHNRPSAQTEPTTPITTLTTTKVVTAT